jgi:DNA-binding transcriptional ArsR family regulator
LRELSREPLLPTQLSLRLRLRTATISHHLKILRLAGLVRIRLEQGTERRYAARLEGVEEATAALRTFLALSSEF